LRQVQALVRQVEAWLPRSVDEVYLIELASMLAFGLFAVAFAAARTRAKGRFEIYYVLTSIGRGAAFPPSVLLTLYPVSEQVRGLFGVEALKLVLMVGGAYSAALSLYATLKGP